MAVAGDLLGDVGEAVAEPAQTDAAGQPHRDPARRRQQHRGGSEDRGRGDRQGVARGRIELAGERHRDQPEDSQRPDPDDALDDQIDGDPLDPVDLAAHPPAAEHVAAERRREKQAEEAGLEVDQVELAARDVGAVGQQQEAPAQRAEDQTCRQQHDGSEARQRRGVGEGVGDLADVGGQHQERDAACGDRELDRERQRGGEPGH